MSERKSLVEVVLMPVVVACVGIGGTYLVTQQREEHSRRLSNVQLENAREQAVADRQVKVLEIFATKITSPEERERILAVRLLSAVDAELAESLAIAVAEVEPTGSAVRRAADEVFQESIARAETSARVYVHIRSEEDRMRARAVGQALREYGYLVPALEQIVESGPDFAQLRYFRPSDETGAGALAERLKVLGVRARTQYIGGFEGDRRVRDGHYELWFPKGEPPG